jgi:hypothetical protein
MEITEVFQPCESGVCADPCINPAHQILHVDHDFAFEHDVDVYIVNFDDNTTIPPESLQYEMTIEWGAMVFRFDSTQTEQRWVANNARDYEATNGLPTAHYLEPNPAAPDSVANNQIRVTNNTDDGGGNVRVVFQYDETNHITKFGTDLVRGRFYSSAATALAGANQLNGGTIMPPVNPLPQNPHLVEVILTADVVGNDDNVRNVWFAFHGAPIATAATRSTVGSITLRIFPG